jgi:hypothetical protein
LSVPRAGSRLFGPALATLCEIHAGGRCDCWHRFVRLQLLTPRSAANARVPSPVRCERGRPRGSMPRHRGGYSCLLRGLLDAHAKLSRRHGQEHRLLGRVRARRAVLLTGLAASSSIRRTIPRGPHHAAPHFKKNARIEKACGVLHRSLGERRSFVAIRCAYATSELRDKVWSRV